METFGSYEYFLLNEKTWSKLSQGAMLGILRGEIGCVSNSQLKVGCLPRAQTGKVAAVLPQQALHRHVPL
jgi:hypothetical protein